MRLWSSIRRRPWEIVVGVVAIRVFVVVMGPDFTSWVVVDVISVVPLSYVLLRFKDTGPVTAAALAVFASPSLLYIISFPAVLFAYVVVGVLVISFIAGLIAAVLVGVVARGRRLIATWEGGSRPG